jgi:HTH-type transcriptional regulator/antitoxin MqsA
MEPQMSVHTCPICTSDNLSAATRTKVFARLHGEVKVELLYSHCASCGSDIVTEQQSVENKKRMRAREKQYEGFLTGQQIFALRRRYGLTQKDAAKVFGGGPVAFSKYESEDILPTEAMNKLLWLAIEMPEAVQRLAEAADVKLKGLATKPDAKARTVAWKSRVFEIGVPIAEPAKLHMLGTLHPHYGANGDFHAETTRFCDTAANDHAEYRQLEAA